MSQGEHAAHTASLARVEGSPPAAPRRLRSSLRPPGASTAYAVLRWRSGPPGDTAWPAPAQLALRGRKVPFRPVLRTVAHPLCYLKRWNFLIR